MRLLLFILAILPVVICCKQSNKNKINLDTNKSVDAAASMKRQDIYIDLVKLLENPGNKRDSIVYVHLDPFYKRPKRYKGYPFDSIVDSIVKIHKFDTTNAIIVFECTDGYKPTMNISEIFGDTKGYVVFKDLEQHKGKDWADSVYTKFEPFYLVWDTVDVEDDSFKWPYGLIGIRLLSRAIAYESIYPSDDLFLDKGFNLFVQNCIKCHSINKVGGSKGPEFNFPKNITEYWNEKDMMAYARNPAAYRYNATMAGITNLSDSDFKELISYIKYMKNNKLKY